MTTATETKTIKYAVIAALALGAPLEDGKFAGLITLPDGKHVAVVLLPNKSDKRLKWAKAVAWAEEAGGQLPSRPVGALLFANLRGEFEKTWHWTNETCDFDYSYAWLCDFFHGSQYGSYKSSEGSARVVRLIHITD